jgi:hypothetical protein
MREIDMATAVLDSAYVDSYRRFLHSRIADQAAYHHRTAERNERLHHRLHRLATAFFWVTLAICAVHLVADVLHLEHEGPLTNFWRVEPIAAAGAIRGNALLTAFAAALPAFGRALAGISSQGEFDRVARRSAAMAAALGGLAQRLDRAATDASPSSSACAQVAEAAAEMMTAELLDWQVTFRAKSLELPA